MNTAALARLMAAGALWLSAAVVLAQESPPPEPQSPVPPAEAAPEAAPAPETEAATAPEPVAAPAPESGSAPAPAPEADAAAAEAVAPETTVEPGPAATAAEAEAPRAAVKRIVMLPVEFTVYQKSVAGVEAVPDWTENAKFALGDASIKMLQQDDRFQVMALPQIDGETQGLLREHVELFKIIGNTVTSMLQYGGKAWAEKRANFDYTLGDGLGFLADASGADYAFLLAGAQIAQTGGAVFLELLITAAGGYGGGGGTFVFAGIVDLRSGDVKWFNHRAGAQVFGMTGTDVRKPETALEVVRQMFAGFPESKLVKFPAF